jgi:nicotinamide mononucleotide (NMN) deamidase PncC
MSSSGGLLGVDPLTIAEHGAVSEATVKEMAAGAARVAGAALAVAVSGVAGPDGGSTEKPVGTVWFGFSINGEVDAQRVIFPGSRADIRRRAAQFALHGLLRRVRQMTVAKAASVEGGLGEVREFLPDPPQVGALVRVRSRQYLVENRLEPPQPGEATIVRMSCLDDDAQGEPLDPLGG